MPRDSSGAYTLPTGNPVIDGTVIESEWANDTMADIAVQMNNVLTRDGLLGPIAPMLFVNGTVPLPGIAFQESPSTGLMRLPPNVLQLVINGVARQIWNPTGTNVIGTFAASGNASIGGDLTVTGNFSFGGVTPIAFPPGTALLPGITFVGDPNTGFYSPGPDTIGFSTGGLNRMTLNVNGALDFQAPTLAGSPVISMIVAAGGFGIDMRGRTGDQLSVLRLLTNDYTTQLFTVQANNVSSVIGSTQAIPLSIFTNAVSRINISAAGNVTFATPTTGGHTINGPVTFGGGADIGFTGSIFAPNFFVGATAAAAGTVGVASNLGAAAVYWGNSSPGAGAMDLYGGGSRQIQVVGGAGAVNYWAFTGALAGGRLVAEARGASGDLGIWTIAKGTGDILFSGNGGNSLQLLHPVAGARWIQITGSATDPILSTSAGKLSIPPPTKFGGALTSTGDLSTVYSQAAANAYSFIDSTRAANNKVVELLWNTGAFSARFLNDLNNDARNIWVAQGGVALGVTDLLFYTGPNDLTMRMFSAGGGGGKGWVGVGPVQPQTQLQVTGLGQIGPTVFDPAVTAGVGATLFLSDTGTSAGNGGCIMFGAFNASHPNHHFAAIKGFITDAASNSAGELIFTTKTASTDTGSTQALRITADKSLYDSRNLTLARDPGATVPPTAASTPIGSFAVANGGAGNVNALTGTRDGATLTMRGLNAGTNAVLPAGTTWRCIGALDSSSTNALWLRIA